jgi:hypothetical protein
MARRERGDKTGKKTSKKRGESLRKSNKMYNLRRNGYLFNSP